MVALDKHKPWQASTILAPAKLQSSAPRLLAGDPELSADLCSHRVTIFAVHRVVFPQEGQGTGAWTGVLGHC